MKINNVIKSTSLVFIYIQIYFKIRQKYWNKDEKYMRFIAAISLSEEFEISVS